MKKTVICQIHLVLLMLLLLPGSLRAQGPRVSLDLTEVPLETAMQHIKQQTNYLFVNMNVDTQKEKQGQKEQKEKPAKKKSGQTGYISSLMNYSDRL